MEYPMEYIKWITPKNNFLLKLNAPRLVLSLLFVGRGQNAESYSVEYPMEYPKNHFLVKLNALSICLKHLHVHTLIYFELSNNT